MPDDCPSWTNTANARSPRNPVNQACERGGTAVPYSAVPVLPDTGPPGTSRSAVAVPSVTTARIMSRSAGSTAAGGPAGAGPAAGAPATSDGTTGPPLATCAEISAIVSGLTSTRPWPIASAAFSVSSLGTGTDPPNELAVSFQSVPTP